MCFVFLLVVTYEYSSGLILIVTYTQQSISLPESAEINAGIGTLATTIGLPGRYIHSPATMVDLSDVEAAKQIIIKIIEEFNSDKLNDLLD